MKSYIVNIIITGVISLTGFYGYKICNTSLSVKKLTIDNLNEHIAVLENNTRELDRSITAQRIEIDKLNQVITRNDQIINDNKIELQRRLDDINYWSNQPPKIKYKYITKEVQRIVYRDINYTTATCQEALELNQAIANIQYNDLSVTKE